MEKFISTHLMEIGFTLILLCFMSRFILYPLEEDLPVDKNEDEKEDFDEEAESAPIQYLIPTSVDKYLAGPSKIRLGSSYLVCKYLFPTLFDSKDPISEAGNKSHVINEWYIATFKEGILVKFQEIWPDDTGNNIELIDGQIFNSRSGKLIGFLDAEEQLKFNALAEERIKLMESRKGDE